MRKKIRQMLFLLLLLSSMYSSVASAQQIIANENIYNLQQQNIDQAIIPKSTTNFTQYNRLPLNSNIFPASWALTFNNTYPSFYVNEQDGTVYVSTDDALTAYSADKQLLWKKPYTLGWTVVGSNGLIYASSGCCTTYAIDSNGNIEWTYPQRLTRLILANDNSLYGEVFENDKEYIIKLNANGEFKWKGLKPTSYSMSTPTVDQRGNIYLTDDKHIYMINGQTGQQSIFYTFSSTIQAMDIKVDKYNTVYVVNYAGTIYAIGANKQLKWQRYVQQGLGSVTPGNNGDVYVKSNHHLATLYALSESGEVKWQLGKYGYNGQAPVLGKDGILYDSAYLMHNGNIETHVYAVDPITGKELWQSPIQIGESFDVKVTERGIYHTTEHTIQFIETGILFEDKQLEAFIRQQIKKPTGAILPKDIEHIEELDIGPKEITSLKGLQHFKNLKSLIVYGNLIEDLSSLQTLTQLEHLDISNNNVKDLTPIQHLTNLEVLEFSKNKIEDITALQHLTKLQFIDMTSNIVQKLLGIENLTSLKALLASYNAIGSSRTINTTDANTLAPIRNLQQLEVLELSNNDLSTLVGVEELKSLKTVEVAHNNITSLTPLNNLSKLASVNVSNNQLQSIEHFKNVSITNLNIAGNEIQYIQPLKQLPNLQAVNIKANPIIDFDSLTNAPIHIISDSSTNTTNENDVTYATSKFRTTTDPYKKWKIHLSVPIQKQTLTNENIFVKNSEGETVATKFIYDEGSKKIEILPPTFGYDSYETYTIYVKNLKSVSGRTVKPIKMTFLAQWKFVDDAISTSRNLNNIDFIGTFIPVYDFYDKLMTAIEIYHAYRDLGNVMKRDTFTEKFLLEENFKEGGSAGHIMNAVRYIDDQAYLTCISQNLHIKMCLDVLNTNTVKLPTEYVKDLMEDLIEEITSIQKTIEEAEKESDDKAKIVLPYPTFYSKIEQNVQYISVQLSEINTYQLARQQHPFYYKKRNAFMEIFARDLKIKSTQGENLEVGKSLQLGAYGNGEFLQKEYRAFELTHLMDALWVSHDLSIATVTENGLVHAKKAGEVEIEVMYKGKTDSFTIVVK